MSEVLLAKRAADRSAAPELSFVDKLNSVWHERAGIVFTIIVLGHWAEHLLQAYQVYVLKWPRPRALGLLGQFWPSLIKSEVLHYGYALVMLVFLWVLRKGFVGRARFWWTAALSIQFWHHIEHALLQVQVIVHRNLFGQPVPTSVVQLWIPRVELHLFYNSVVFIPMVVAMYLHLLPAPNERAEMKCSCAMAPRASAASAA
jgi:hypothetical protein